MADLAVLHAIVCRVRPHGTQHAFVFDPRGILSDCRYLRDALQAEQPDDEEIDAAEEQTLDYFNHYIAGDR